MTRLFYAFLVLCLVLPAAVSAAEKTEIEAASTIKAVTVYAGRAKITRVATVDIPAGAHTVVFKGLPSILFPDSLRAEGTSKADVAFGAVTHKQIMSAQLTSEREKELNDKLEALNDHVMMINAEKAAIESRKNFLSNLGQQATLRSNEEIAEINLKPEQWGAAAMQIYTGALETLKALVQQDLKLREINREITKLQNEIALLRTGQTSTFTVAVPLESSAATQLTVELSYQIPNANWTPIYDARLSSEGKGDLKLIQFGSVSQQTGEDWSGVKLTLSTAQPQRGASLPDLTPMWVDAYEGSAGYGGNTRFRDMSSNIVGGKQYAPELQMDSVDVFDGGGRGGGYAAPAAAPAEAEKKVTYVAPKVQTGGFVTEYSIPGPAEVLADGTETKLMVGAFDTNSVLEVHVKPQLSTDAFLVAMLKLKGDSPILPGQVNLFRDGAFVGQSYINLLRPDEEYGMYFGVDDQVSVKRRVLKDEQQEQGVIARDSVRERQYVTEIQNLHATPIALVVKETIPVPRNEKMKLALQREFTTPGFKEDAANIKGMLEWDIKVEPKAKQEVKLGWNLSWPKDYAVSGLQ